MNVIAMEKGKERWGMIADDIWDMLLGKAGKLPGQLAPEIIEKAEREGRKFFTGNPQDNYPDALDKYRKLMKENKWELGEDDEELFEYAMHPAQYEAYKVARPSRTSWRMWRNAVPNVTSLRWTMPNPRRSLCRWTVRLTA